ncbi:MAG TPA: fatty acid desaturase [Rhizomicrobium sp.]|nr:fatty acid desaturase [Rhizomicrobium sp.]
MSTSALPRETSRYQRLNMVLGLTYAAATLAVLLILPAAFRLHLLDAAWGWFCIALPVALVSNGFWALQHEAIHNLFAADQAVNRRVGRLMSVLFGSSFRVLRFGHLMHHRFNRHPLDCPDAFDPKTASAVKARIRFFTEIFGGLYLIEAFSPLLYWLPAPAIRRLLARIYGGDDLRLKQLHQLAGQALGSPRAIGEIRQDSAMVLALYGCAFALWGTHWLGLLIFILLRGMLISFLDNIYHFRTPLDRPDFAYNLQLARPFRALILNMNFHRVHHNNMHLPWWRLPLQFERSQETFDGGYFNAALAQFQGPAPTHMLGTHK